MFRGEPPIGNVINPDLAEYSSMMSLLYIVDLLRVEVEGLPSSKSYTVQIDVINGKRVNKKKVKGPIARIHGSKLQLLSSLLAQRKAKSQGKILSERA